MAHQHLEFYSTVVIWPYLTKSYGQASERNSIPQKHKCCSVIGRCKELTLKITAIADTHGKHKDLILPSGHILIHAGDISLGGQEDEIIDFLTWFVKQDFRYKILIAGNHDFYFERESDEQIEKTIPKGIIYLKDTGTIIEGLKIWGSPITPWYFNWAFNRHRGESIQRHWDLIPNEVDILITHGPVFRTLDRNRKGQHVGCKDLFLKIQQIKPKVHICGHIHEAYGMIEKTDIKFINACILNDKYEMVNSPIEFEL